MCDERVATDPARPERRREPPTQSIVPLRYEQSQLPIAPVLAPAVDAAVGRGGAMPARARNLERCADPSSRRDVVGLHPDIAGPERRGRVVGGTDADAGPIRQQRHPKPRPRARRVARPIIGDILLARDDANLRLRRRRPVLRRHEIHAQQRGQHDDVDPVDRSERNTGGIEIDGVAPERQHRHAVPVDLERRGPATAIQQDFRLAIPAAPRDVDAGDVVEQITQRACVRQEHGIGGEGVAHALGERTGHDRRRVVPARVR